MSRLSQRCWGPLFHAAFLVLVWEVTQRAKPSLACAHTFWCCPLGVLSLPPLFLFTRILGHTRWRQCRTVKSLGFGKLAELLNSGVPPFLVVPTSRSGTAFESLAQGKHYVSISDHYNQVPFPFKMAPLTIACVYSCCLFPLSVSEWTWNCFLLFWFLLCLVLFGDRVSLLACPGWLGTWIAASDSWEWGLGRRAMPSALLFLQNASPSFTASLRHFPPQKAFRKHFFWLTVYGCFASVYVCAPRMCQVLKEFRKGSPTWFSARAVGTFNC